MKSPEFCTAKLAIFPEIAWRPKDPPQNPIDALKLGERSSPVRHSTHWASTRGARHLPYRVHRTLAKIHKIKNY